MNLSKLYDNQNVTKQNILLYIIKNIKGFIDFNYDQLKDEIDIIILCNSNKDIINLLNLNLEVSYEIVRTCTEPYIKFKYKKKVICLTFLSILMISNNCSKYNFESLKYKNELGFEKKKPIGFYFFCSTNDKELKLSWDFFFKEAAVEIIFNSEFQIYVNVNKNQITFEKNKNF